MADENVPPMGGCSEPAFGWPAENQPRFPEPFMSKRMSESGVLVAGNQCEFNITVCPSHPSPIKYSKIHILRHFQLPY